MLLPPLLYSSLLRVRVQHKLWPDELVERLSIQQPELNSRLPERLAFLVSLLGALCDVCGSVLSVLIDREV